MNIDTTIFKSYDIRGVYPTQINEQNYPTILKAIYTFFLEELKRESLTVVLGRDMRLSGPALMEVAKKTLVELGAIVVDVGLVSTPTFYFASLHNGYDCGIQISASHNPKEYTGIKFAIRDGDTVRKVAKGSGMERIKELVEKQEFASPRPGGKVIENSSVVQDEVQAALQLIDGVKVKPFKVVADPANAMGILYLNELFKHLPCQLIKMNFELDGNFPVHQPDPLVFENLTALREKVVNEHADLGIAPDGDGDRIFFINEKGEVVKATSITNLIAHEILKRQKGEGIIADIRDIRNVKKTCEELGGMFHMSIVGHSHITKQLNDTKSAFAGESSGHFFFRETGGGESAVRVILYVLKAMTEEQKPISAIVSQYITSYEYEERNFVISPPADPKIILDTIAKDYSDGHVYRDDGLSADYADWRFNIRQSNTENEPILRVNVEGINQQVVDGKFEEIKQKIIAMGGKSK